jgi:hypothetical protein
MLFILNYNKWYYYVKLLIYKIIPNEFLFYKLHNQKILKMNSNATPGMKTMSIPNK